jgi:hypothetical protein
MAIEPLPETTPPCEEISPDQPANGVTDPTLSDAAERPVELSKFSQRLARFSQRLASFGLGEAPDLLTEARPPAKRRSRT